MPPASSWLARTYLSKWSPRYVAGAAHDRTVGVIALAAAPAWRRHLERSGRVRVVALTGSAGKTTTAHLLAACLATDGPVSHTERLVGRLNSAQMAARLILATRTSHKYCVCELGVGGPGTATPFLELLRPHIGIVTNIAGDHYSAFRSLDETAREKQKLVQALPADGVAVLNLDDPRVAAMRNATRARVLTYGLASHAADVQGTDVSAAWPDRLALTVRHGPEEARVHTRLVGAHFAVPTLAALAGAIAAGVHLSDAAAALATVEPAEGRCSVEEAGGVTFIRDDWKAPLWSFEAALAMIAAARARRRLVVVGTISDYPGARSPKYRAVARAAAASADEVIFVGPAAHQSHLGDVAPGVRTFETLREAHAYLESRLGPGDLVLLKGSLGADHLQRLVLARTGGVDCWRRSCARYRFCTDCDLRFRPERPAATGG